MPWSGGTATEDGSRPGFRFLQTDGGRLAISGDFHEWVFGPCEEVLCSEVEWKAWVEGGPGFEGSFGLPGHLHIGWTGTGDYEARHTGPVVEVDAQIRYIDSEGRKGDWSEVQTARACLYGPVAD